MTRMASVAVLLLTFCTSVCSPSPADIDIATTHLLVHDCKLQSATVFTRPLDDVDSSHCHGQR